MEKIHIDEKLNFINLTRRFWKEQFFFYILCTFSCFGSHLVDDSLIKILNQTLSKLKNKNYSENYYLNFSINFLDWEIKDFKNDKNKYLISIFFLISFYALIVFFHVWYSSYLQNKVRNYVKENISKKIFSLKNYDKKKAISLLTYNARVFSESVFYVPNQIYYVLIDISLSAVSLFKISQRNLTNLSLFYLFSLLTICSILQYFLYKKELFFQNSLEDEMKKELFLVDNRNLIIKKNSVSGFLNSYYSVLRKTFDYANERDWMQSFSFVFPSFFLIKLFPALFIFFASVFNKDVLNAVHKLIKLFDNFKKIIERSKSYPFSISSQNKINEFIQEEERNDFQNNLIVNDKIEKIYLKNISFSYKSGEKEILNGLNMHFKLGSINRMDFPNGFGKSTIINIIMGLLNPQKGEVIINENYNLKDLDLRKWRQKFSYSEHKNLVVQENFSTGQKQLIDLENSFNKEDKEIYIFDEADSNLDFNNRDEFLKKVEDLSKRKIVILVSHLSNKKD